MIKTEIKNFKVSAGGYTDLPVVLPASAYGAVHAAGILPDPYFADNILRYSEISDSRCTFVSEFEYDQLSFSMNYSLLWLHRIDHACTVFLNDTVVAELKEPITDLAINAKGILTLGKNVLKIVFEKECKSSYISSDRISRLAVGECSIVCYNDDIISRMHVESEMLNDSVRLHLKLDTHEDNGTTRAVATLVSPGGRVYYCGLMNNCGYIDITDPNYWWPSGLGVQNLYKLTVNLYMDSEIVDSRDMNIGLSRYETSAVDGCKIPKIYVNGVRLYSRGACYLPDDALLPMLDRSRMSDLLTSSKNAGFNTVVVRDGLFFPENEFFDVCDELGLVVWVEINAAALSDERREAFLRSAANASYHTSFGAVVSVGEGAESLADTLSEKLTHTMVITTDDLDDSLMISRASVPGVHTVMSFADSSDSNIFSPCMELHTTLRDNKEMISSEIYRFPLSTEEIAYVTQMEDAYFLAKQIDFVRRKRGDVLHSILPRLSDPWGQISESCIDVRGKWKAQQYALRSLFAPVRVGAVNDGTRVTFTVSNEGRTVYNGKLNYAVCDSSGEVIFRDGFAISVPENSASDILTIDLYEAVAGKEDSCFVIYSISDGMIVTSKGTLLFTSPKRFAFKKPNITADISGNGTHFVISVSADVFVHALEISFEDFDAFLEENYIDITDKSPLRIEFTTDKAVAAPLLRRKLVLRSSYDIGKN